MNKTKLYYDGIAKGYKDLYHHEQENKINLIKEEFPKKGTILDLGSGDGVLNKFFEDNKNINLISCDLSIKLLKLNPNKKRINVNILSLPLKNNTFDSIISMTVIQDILDSKKAISEIHRVLKPNGKLIISFLKMSLKREAIEYELNQKFKIIKNIEEEKDIILILEK